MVAMPQRRPPCHRLEAYVGELAKSSRPAKFRYCFGFQGSHLAPILLLAKSVLACRWIMDLQPEHLRYILGLKVKRRRQELALGLKAVATRTGLSVSYLSEIERARKYPKPDKLLKLAEALDLPFDRLVSLEMSGELGPVASLVRSRFLKDFPFEMFGLRAEDLLELVSGAPERAAALVRTVAEVGQTYDLRVEHFLFAALRSWQQMRGNFFEEIETAATRFAADEGWDLEQPLDETRLRNLLEHRFGYRIDTERLPADPALAALRSVRVAGGDPNFFLNGKLLEAQRAFAYGRELGYQALAVKERSATSSPVSVASFEQVINDFRAAYFAGALLVPLARFTADLEAFFARDRWSASALRDLLAAYPVTPETFLYRLTQVAPGRLGLRELFFMRFAHRAGSQRFILTKNLNMSRVAVPHGVGLGEHYCRRWPGLEILGGAGAKHASSPPDIAVQRSRFVDPGSTFFVLALARPLRLVEQMATSISIGFLVYDTFRQRVRFWHDPAIPEVDVDLTCERCALTACTERAAAPEVVDAQARRLQQAEALERLRAGVRSKGASPRRADR